MRKFAAIPLAAVLLLTGCGKAEESGNSGPEDTRVFTEEDFDNICRNVRLGVSSVTVPGTLDDFDRDFFYDTLLVNASRNETSYNLFYGGEVVAQVIYHSSEELPISEMLSTPYFTLILDGMGGKGIEQSAGDIKVGDGLEQVTAAYGKNAEVIGGSDSEIQTYTYRLSDEKRVSFVIENGKVATIMIKNDVKE